MKCITTHFVISNSSHYAAVAEWHNVQHVAEHGTRHASVFNIDSGLETVVLRPIHTKYDNYKDNYLTILVPTPADDNVLFIISFCCLPR